MKTVMIQGVSFATRHAADDAVVRELMTKRCYERPRLGFTVRAGETWLDCGANIGAFAVWAEKIRGARVFGYEACQENTTIAQQNLRQNHCISTVETAFVSARKQGKASVCFNARTPARSSPAAKGLQRYVPKVSLEEEIAKHNPTGLKIDIEGGEFELLDHGFDLGNVQKIAIEYHFRFDKDCRKARGRLQPLLQTFKHSSVPKTVFTEDVWPAWQDAILLFWN